MSDTTKQDAADKPSDTIDLIELVLVVWRRRRVIYVCVAATVFLALVWLHITPYTYTAQMMVVPIQGSSSGSSSRLGGLSSLATAAGVSLPQDQSLFQFTLYVEGLHSRAAAEAVAKKTELMKILYAGEWNAETNSWEKPKGPVRFVAKVIKSAIGMPDVPWQQPNGARLQQYIEQRVQVSENTKKPIVTVTFDHADPAFAVAFLVALDKAVDGELRGKALFRSSQNIAYLSEKLKTVTLSEQREAIMRALSEQERAAMMANSTASFAAETFGPPYQSFRPTSPKPLKNLGMAIAIGLLLGIGLAFMAPARWISRLVPNSKSSAERPSTVARPLPHAMEAFAPTRNADTTRRAD